MVLTSLGGVHVSEYNTVLPASSDGASLLLSQPRQLTALSCDACARIRPAQLPASKPTDGASPGSQPLEPASRLLTRMDEVSHDVLAVIACFLPIADLLNSSALSSSLHAAFDSDRVWRPRLPPPTATTAQSEAVSASCKSRYIAQHACSEHEVQRCYRLLPPGEPIQRPAHYPMQLAFLRLDRKLVPRSPKPAVTPLPLCRACTRSIAAFELDRQPAMELKAWGERSLSCLVRLSQTEYDVRYSHVPADTDKWELYGRCTIAPVVTARLLLSRLLPRFVGPADAGGTRYRCSAWTASWPHFDDDELLGMCAVQPADNVDWPGRRSRTAGRELHCNAHRASGCLSVLHHYQRLQGVLLSRCDRCRVALPAAMFHCSLCLFCLCEACGEAARSEVHASDLLWDGEEMAVWTDSQTHVNSSRQYVWWAPPDGVRRLGTLCWCDAAQRQWRRRSVDRELPLHHISNITVGRPSPVLQSPQTEEQLLLPQCFALASRRVTFRAQCDSAEARDGWLCQLKQLLVRGGKTINSPGM